jgi:hypothetical protein
MFANFPSAPFLANNNISLSHQRAQQVLGGLIMEPAGRPWTRIALLIEQERPGALGYRQSPVGCQNRATAFDLPKFRAKSLWGAITEAVAVDLQIPVPAGDIPALYLTAPTCRDRFDLRFR